MNKSLIVWHTIFSVNSEIIDTQHKMLIDLINQLYDAIKHQTNTSTIEDIFNNEVSDQTNNNTIEDMLNCLIDYTIIHFSFEENLMKKHNFPERETVEHKKAHEKFTQFILAEQKKLKSSDDTVIGEEVLDFLKDWLLNHIMKVDRKLGDFLSEKPIKL